MDNVRNDIDKLFNSLEQSKLYNDYLSVKKQLSENTEIMFLIENIKRYQKILVNNKDEKIEKELPKLYETLNNYPIYQSYLDILEELNNELGSVKTIFENFFKSVLEIK